MKKKYLTDEEESEYLKSKQFQQDIKKFIEEETWEQGFPKVYKDKFGNIVQHWKNGTINILHYKGDKHGK